MRRLLLPLFLLLLANQLNFAQTSVVYAYNYPVDDAILSGLSSIRGIAYADNPFGDGTPLIAATNYNETGTVSLLIPAGQDSLQIVWTSPLLKAGSSTADQTPRYVVLGDLDNDGLIEVICQVGPQGIYIFEWDGVAGSYNFGTAPSQIITLPALLTTDGNTEYMECEDVDGDGQNELLVAYNSSAGNSDDAYLIIGASGTWATDDPGFSTFNVEYQGIRTDLTAWGLDGGSPYAMIAADFLGNGKKEILIHNWNLKNITLLNSTSADNYKLVDTAGGKQNIYLGQGYDDVALFGGMAYDVDGDGREEVYLPTYAASSPDGKLPHKSFVHMIHFEDGQTTNSIDSTNVFNLNFASLYDASSNNWSNNTLGIGYGDVEGTGKNHIYVSSGYPRNIMSAEYEGGDKTDLSNWKFSVLYKGDISTEYHIAEIKDSLGVIDTTNIYDNDNAAIASKIFIRNTDINRNGKQDIIIPYQTIPDSFQVRQLTWNSTASKYDTVNNKILNPKRWSLRIIERETGTGIAVKDLVVISPNDYKLYQNYPNPFNPTTKISFYLPVQNKVSLKIYNILGKEVVTLIDNTNFSKGEYNVVWDGTNNLGNKVASGNYICSLRFGNFTKSIKMTLLK